MIEIIEKKLKSLNEYQYNAVIDDSNACIVKANVGSGKTTVLISKILYLSQSYNLSDIIVLTFTNKAAQEIKERLLELNDKIAVNNLVYCGTFHSVALKLLQTKLNVEKLGYTKDFTIVDPLEESEIANEIVFNNLLNIKYMNKLEKRIEQGKADYINQNNSKYNDDIFKLLDLLKDEKIKQNKMSFDDLIINATLLLKDKEIYPSWIVIDEFQDCNMEQLDFINIMKGTNTKLFVVGDENQIIYSWRNTTKDIFKNFKIRYNAKELSLPINYRSTKSILEVAKSVLKDTTDLVGIRDIENKVIIKNHYDSFNEAQYLSEKIKAIVNNGCDYKDIAILYRTQKQSKVLASVFDNEKITYEISLRKTLKDIPVLCWFISLLKCSVNSNDTMNIIKVLTNDKYCDNFTKSQVKELLKGNSSNDFYNKILQFNNSKLTDANDIYNYFDLDACIKPTFVSYKDDKRLIFILIEKIQNYIVHKNISLKEGINEFINSSALYGIDILNDNINIKKNCVKLMTLHASKGLEFKYVFIIGANYGLIPIHTKNEFEYNEEKRLFFVGITRAKDYLEISYYTKPDEQRVTEGKSIFLNDIPSSLIESEESNVEVNSLEKLRKILNENQNSEVSFDEEDVKTILETKIVKHIKYGMGQVIKEDEDTITINFDKYGEKEFLKDLEVYELIK